MPTHRHPGTYVSRTPRGNMVRKKNPMHIQTLIFPKEEFTRQEASDWAKEHGFKSYTSREEGNSIRVRQFDPSEAKRFGGTISMGKSVRAVVAERKRVVR